MSDIHPASIGEIGEQAVLQLLHPFCSPNHIGDDAAVLQLKAGCELVVTTDMLVDDVHFSDRTLSASDVGWRAAAVNLSDLAAMGAHPIGITVALGLPSHTPQSWLLELYQGLRECLSVWGGVILGGDVTRSPHRILSITALGEVQSAHTILRHQAQVGDAILATGWHGSSRAGLELLLNPRWGADLSESVRNNLTRRHQRPNPRLDVIRMLQEIKIQRCAGMDSSDGLADAVLQICRASGVGATLKRNHLPLHPALTLTQDLSPEQAVQWALYGGEDFELVLTMSPSDADKLVAKMPGTVIVGQVTTGLEVWVSGDSGGTDQRLSLEHGFQHW